MKKVQNFLAGKKKMLILQSEHIFLILIELWLITKI